MMGRVRWSHVTIALALIAALAIAAPAIGGPSLQEVGQEGGLEADREGDGTRRAPGGERAERCQRHRASRSRRSRATER